MIIAHVAGLPIEETLATGGPALLTMLTFAAAGLRARLGRGGRNLFEPDRMLQARTAVAMAVAVLTTALLVAVVALGAVVLVWWFPVFVLLYAVSGLIVTNRARRRSDDARTAPLAPGVERRVRELLGRLAAVCDLPAPRLVFEPADAPLSWTTALPWRPATIHVTTGLVCECTAAELEAVLAHELAHIANRDAMVMRPAARRG